MDNTEEKMIIDLSLDKISKEEFLRNYPVNLSENPKYFVDVLEQTLINNNSDDVECVLLVAGYIDDINVYLPLIRKLIVEDWHNQHEIMVDILSGSANKDDAKYFYHVLHANYDYIEDVEDFLVPIWVKCVWALGKIGTDEARNYLEEFKNSPYERVKKATSIQFEKNNWN